VKPLAALEALGRGISNVRGNVELVGVSAAGSLTVIAVVVLTLIPWLGLGGDDLRSLLNVVLGQGGAGDVATLGARSWQVLSHLWQFLLAFTIGSTIASFVFAWYFGGVLGVLVAGDAQAPPGPGRSHELFRTWSRRFFVGESNRLTMRVLLYYSVCLSLLLGVMLVFGLVVGLGVSLAGAGTAALAIGCGAALPFFFAFFATALAISIGQVTLVPAEGGLWPVVRDAVRSGYVLLGRRLGAALGLYVLLLCASFAIALVEGGASLFLSVALRTHETARLVFQGALFFVELMVGAYLNLVLAAALVALVRAERPEPPAATA